MNEDVLPEARARQSREPILETQISKSKDGKWIIVRTIITDIKPVGYYQKVLASDSSASPR